VKSATRPSYLVAFDRAGAFITKPAQKKRWPDQRILGFLRQKNSICEKINRIFALLITKDNVRGVA
jgi:hypothetical protein